MLGGMSGVGTVLGRRKEEVPGDNIVTRSIVYGDGIFVDRKFWLLSYKYILHWCLGFFGLQNFCKFLRAFYI